MNAPRDPDVILATWLDDGPADLPSSTRRAISTAVRTTPQSRAGLGLPAWRPTMSKFLALAGAAAVVAVVVGALAIGLPRPRPIGGPRRPYRQRDAQPDALADNRSLAPRPPRPRSHRGSPDSRPSRPPCTGSRSASRRLEARLTRATRRWQASDQGKDPDATILGVLLNPQIRRGRHRLARVSEAGRIRCRHHLARRALLHGSRRTCARVRPSRPGSGVLRGRADVRRQDRVSTRDPGVRSGERARTHRRCRDRPGHHRPARARS